MVKLSDFSKLTGKLDVAGMVKNVKSMVNPDHATMTSVVADVSTIADPLSQKLTEIKQAVQNLATTTAEQSEIIAKLNKALTALNQEIEALKKTNAPTAVVTAISSAETSTSSVAGKADSSTDKMNENKTDAS